MKSQHTSVGLDTVSDRDGETVGSTASAVGLKVDIGNDENKHVEVNKSR